MIGGLIKACATYVGSSTAIAALRRREIVKVNTSKIQQPLLRDATEYYLRVGDATLDFIQAQMKGKAK